MKRILLAFLLISSFAHGQNAFKAYNSFTDTTDFIGKIIHSGITSASSSSADSVWVKDASTGIWKLRAQSAIAGTKPTLTKNAMVESPTAAENIGFGLRTPVAITITNTHAVLVGSASPSVTYQINFGTDRTSGTNVYTAGQTVTSTTTGTAASGVNDATIPAGSWIWITTSAQSGTVTQIELTITYTED